MQSTLTLSPWIYVSENTFSASRWSFSLMKDSCGQNAELALGHPRLRQSDLINQGVGLDRCHGSRNDIDIVSKRHYLKLVP